MFEDSNGSPLLLPTNFLEVKTQPKLMKCLLSFVVQLDLQFHLFRICSGSSLMIPSQLFPNFDQFQAIIRRNGSWVFFWT